MSEHELKQGSRLFYICLLCVFIALVSTIVAQALLMGIRFCTNIFYFQSFSMQDRGPSENLLGWVAIFVPAIGGLIVGLIARYGSSSIRGHGIPEAMENILKKDSRIARRVAILKPLSSAIAIGSGGPFGAEGPIIATGGALGSWLGQILPVSAYERKILLAAGSAAGMTAIFGTPLSALMLSIELLLFEYRSKSFTPVAMATIMAFVLRNTFISQEVFFKMPELMPTNVINLLIFILLGVLLGFLSIVVTKSIYWIEDHVFEKLPMHWMWWPPLGGLIVGVIGLIAPQTLGVGYENINMSLSGQLTLVAALSLFCWKFLSWAFALGSGTSGGTLAPLLTLGSSFGLIMSSFLHFAFPQIPIDPHAMALVGMAALFAGCSHALLASVFFAFEGTGQVQGLIPLLTCCTIAYLISSLFMKNSIMTEKIFRRGVRVPHEYYPRHES